MSKILLVEFKKGRKQPEAYTSVPGFIERYPNYTPEKLNYHLSRLKRSFEDNTLRITRIEIHEREKS